VVLLLLVPLCLHVIVPFVALLAPVLLRVLVSLFVPFRAWCRDSVWMAKC
jgi:hypothetical protein